MVGSSVNSMLITYFVVLHFSRLNLTFPCRLYLLIEEGKEKKKKKKAGYQSLVGYHWRGLYVMILGWGKCATQRHLNCVSHKNSIYMVDSTTLCPSSSPKKKLYVLQSIRLDEQVVDLVVFFPLGLYVLYLNFEYMRGLISYA